MNRRDNFVFFPLSGMTYFYLRVVDMERIGVQKTICQITQPFFFSSGHLPVKCVNSTDHKFSSKIDLLLLQNVSDMGEG